MAKYGASIMKEVPFGGLDRDGYSVRFRMDTRLDCHPFYTLTTDTTMVDHAMLVQNFLGSMILVEMCCFSRLACQLQWLSNFLYCHLYFWWKV